MRDGSHSTTRSTLVSLRGRPNLAGMKYLVALVTGRRTKSAVIAVWIVLVAIFASPGSKLADETSDETQTFLSDSA